MNSFARPPQIWEEIIHLIDQTESGSQLLDMFRPLFAKGTIRIQPYPPELRNQLIAASSEDKPVGAAFITDGQIGTIYLDSSSPLGLVVPFLFHEIFHSLDETLWAAARHPIPISEKRNLIFNAECRAFHAQHSFQEELKARYPMLRHFHQSRYPHLNYLNRALLPHELAELYTCASFALNSYHPKQRQKTTGDESDY